MAYLDLDNAFAAPIASRGARIEGRTGFSPLEWTVIALARHDSLRSLATPGRFDRVMRTIFGLPTRAPLADPRLEALRRLAVLAWHHGVAVPANEVERGMTAGFQRSQIETLVGRVAGLRAA